MRKPIALAALLVVAGCVAAPREEPLPPPPRAVTPRPLPPAPPAADWRDWPATPGSWRYAGDERGSTATFSLGTAEPIAILRCDRRGGRIFLSVAGSSIAPVTIRTSSTSRTLPVGATGGNPGYAAATLTPADPLLDAIAFSRGRFALSTPGAEPLVLPAWGEVGRVIEDCRP